MFLSFNKVLIRDYHYLVHNIKNIKRSHTLNQGCIIQFSRLHHNCFWSRYNAQFVLHDHSDMCIHHAIHTHMCIPAHSHTCARHTHICITSNTRTCRAFVGLQHHKHCAPRADSRRVMDGREVFFGGETGLGQGPGTGWEIKYRKGWEGKYRTGWEGR